MTVTNKTKIDPNVSNKDKNGIKNRENENFSKKSICMKMLIMSVSS